MAEKQKNRYFLARYKLIDGKGAYVLFARSNHIKIARDMRDKYKEQFGHIMLLKLTK